MEGEKRLQTVKQKLGTVSPSFCMAKWKNATLHLHNGNSQSCHHVKSHKIKLDKDNPSSLHNTKIKMEARRQMLSGRRPKECEYCWKIEDTGKLSDRVHKSAEDIYLKHFDEVLKSELGPQMVPSFLEISFDHVCQFSCMYCSSAYSTSWENEIQKYGPYPTYSRFFHSDYNKPLSKDKRNEYIEAFWNWWPIAKKQIEFLRVTGGEPLLSQEFFKLMEKMINDPSPNIQFGVNTNMGVSKVRLQDFVSRLNQLRKKHPKVGVFTSIDSVGKQAEYIRYGLDYEAFLENIHLLLSTVKEPIVFSSTITVNALSLPGLTTLLRQIAEIKQEYPHHTINIDTPYLKNPAHLGVEILSKDFLPYLEEAAQFIKSHPLFRDVEKLKVDRIHSLLANSKMNPAMLFLHRRDFHSFIQEYDKRRGTHFLNVFPEYKAFLSMCQSPMGNWQSSFSRA